MPDCGISIQRPHPTFLLVIKAGYSASNGKQWRESWPRVVTMDMSGCGILILANLLGMPCEVIRNGLHRSPGSRYICKCHASFSCPAVVQIGLETRRRLVLHRPQKTALSVSGRLPHAEQISHLEVTPRVLTLLDGAEPGARRAYCILRAVIELLGFGTLNKDGHFIR